MAKKQGKPLEHTELLFNNTQKAPVTINTTPVSKRGRELENFTIRRNGSTLTADGAPTAANVPNTGLGKKSW
jgi:hypothetical protein